MPSTSAAALPDYLLAVQLPAFPTLEGGFEVESAFAVHLRELREQLRPRFGRLVLVAPRGSAERHAAQAGQLARISAAEGIVFEPAYPEDASSLEIWTRHRRPVWRRLRELSARAGVVHAGMFNHIGHPLMAWVCLAGRLSGAMVIYVVDIDFRQTSARYRRLGIWNQRQYLTNRLFHDPLKWLQTWIAPRLYDLVLLKSGSLVRRFGGGRPNVRDFFDTVHAESDVLTPAQLDARRTHLARPGGELRVVYFGRLVPYKGIDRMVEAVRRARAAGHDVRLTLVGDGEQREALATQGRDLIGCGALRMVPPVAYGAPLFDLLATEDLAVAAPLTEDTPRAAFDAMARGLPILAFDIGYFRDLAEASGAVALARWPEAADLARALGELARDRSALTPMAARAVDFARANTQSIWLERRLGWTLEALERRRRP